MIQPRIGLEAIALDVPQYYLNMSDLAHARGIDPQKYLVGLGQQQMSIATPCEDTVVLAVGAGQRLLKNFPIHPESIGMLIVGTETGVDHSKPVAIYVHKMLNLSPYCRVFDTKHACYGAMSGVMTAIHWLLSRRETEDSESLGSKALVIASDIAHYGTHTPGEPTQGAGAVALLISRKPTLVEFNTQIEGYYSKEVMDFWRPLYSKNAFANGHYSIRCYLDALAGAYGHFKKNSQGKLPTDHKRFADHFSACLYHVPFVKMAHKAHQRLLELDAELSFGKKTPELEWAQSDFEKRVEPSLDWNARVGNIYTGSLFLSLLNYLSLPPTVSTPTQDAQHISLFSYGSGCTAEFLMGTGIEGAHSQISLHPPAHLLDQRIAIDAQQYEEILKASQIADLNDSTVCQPEHWGIQRSIVYQGTTQHQRRYRFEAH